MKFFFILIIFIIFLIFIIVRDYQIKRKRIKLNNALNSNFFIQTINNLIEDKDIYIKVVSKKAYRFRLIVLHIVISSINLPNIGRRTQDQYLNQSWF